MVWRQSHNLHKVTIFLTTYTQTPVADKQNRQQAFSIVYMSTEWGDDLKLLYFLLQCIKLRGGEKFAKGDV